MPPNTLHNTGNNVKIDVVGVGCRGWRCEMGEVGGVDESRYRGCEVNNECCWCRYGCGCGNDRSPSRETMALRRVDAQRCTVDVLYWVMVVTKNE